VTITALACSVCHDTDFYPFGRERTPIVNTCSQSYKFTGKERDSESGLDYFGARFYSSSYGRFLSIDPKSPIKRLFVNPQDLNFYAYAVNNPSAFSDRDGQDWAKLWQATKALLYGKVSLGLGLGAAKVKLGPVKGEVTGQVKTTVDVSQKGISVSYGAEVGGQVKAGSVTVGLESSRETTTVKDSQSALKNPETSTTVVPVVGSFTSTNNGSYNPTPDDGRTGVGVAGDEGATAGAEVGVNNDAVDDFNSAASWQAFDLFQKGMIDVILYLAGSDAPGSDPNAQAPNGKKDAQQDKKSPKKKAPKQ
jgi:RHS repeat-associated protein